MIRLLVFLVAACAAQPLLADEVPLPRPVPQPEAPLPRARPAQSVAAPPAAQATAKNEPAITGTAAPRIFQTACPAVLSGQVEATAMAPIHEGACGARSPLRVGALRVGSSLVKLTGHPILDCAMATALVTWADAIAPSAKVMLGTGLASIDIGTSYMCRRRNNRPTGPLSEHAFADAVDVSSFTLNDGTKVAVESGWPAGGKSAGFLHFAHDAACGDFTTVLGPDANALHRDHFHLDLGCHGKTCTYRLCE